MPKNGRILDLAGAWGISRKDAETVIGEIHEAREGSIDPRVDRAP